MASTECFNGYTTSIAIKFISRNGTFVPALSFVQEKCPIDPVPIVATVFLSVIFIIAFILSLLVLVTIYSSRTLKKLLVYHLFMNLCCIVMVDCLLNLTISISYVATAPWRFGYLACYFNSFATTMMNLVMAFAVFLLALDRLFVAKKYGSYMRLSKFKLTLIIISTWIASIGIASPLVCGYVSSIPYRNRYACTVADPKDMYYLIPQVVIFGIAPAWFIIFIINTLMIFHREQKKHRKVRGNQTFSYFDQILMTPYYKNEAYTAFCVVALAASLIIFWLPFIYVTIVDPYFTNHWNNETTAVNEKTNVPKVQIDHTNLDINTRNLMDTTEFVQNLTTNGSDYSNFVPEMLGTPVYETAFAWLRYLYDLLVPILILAIIKEVRQKCRALIFVCRPNTVDSASPKMAAPPYLNASIRGQTPKDKKQKNMVSFKTPVLFATSEGLHIRTVEDSFAEMSDSRPILGFSRGSNVEPQFSYDLCDVIQGGDEQRDFAFDDNNEQMLNIDMSYQDPVVENAHRVAVGQNPNNFYRSLSAASLDKRPPTPPKRRDSITSNGSPPSDMIEIDLEYHPKRDGGKIVRFNTDLNQLHLRPRTADSDSALEMSTGSRTSTESGRMADVEDHFQPLKNRKPSYSKIKKKHSYPTSQKNNPKYSDQTPSRTATKETKKSNPSIKSNAMAVRTIPPTVSNIKSRHVHGRSN